MTDNDTRDRLATVSYGSLATALDKFNEAGGSPNEIHPSVFPKGTFSGTTIALLVKAFRALGLVDGGDRPVASVDALIDPKTRKSAMVELLEQRYGSLIALPLSKANPKEFNAWFEQFNMSPDDARKAKTFFLHAAKANGIAVSKFITDQFKTRTPSGSRKRVKKTTVSEANSETSDATKNDENLIPKVGASRCVGLRGTSGTVTLTVSANLWELEGENRDFAFFLMDVVKAWERGVESGIWTKAVDIE